MVLILSEKHDVSTNEVIDWLLYKKANFIRINSENKIEVNISLTNETINIELIIDSDKKINLNELVGFWYRRGDLNLPFFKLKKNTSSQKINSFFREERFYSTDFIYSFLKENSNYIGTYKDNNLNKLNVLIQASKLGLKIPNTILSTNKTFLVNQFDKKNSYITKAISNGLSFWYKGYNYFQHTTEITTNDLSNLNKITLPLLIQKQIIKRYELRIFYLKNKFYSSVIFSQNDEKTKVDFRNYNHTKPNRICPFNLPLTIQDKLQLLMNKLGLVSGSIDIMVCENGEYYFLEVNPIGQFKQVSEPCNYNLEKIIATYLTNT